MKKSPKKKLYLQVDIESTVRGKLVKCDVKPSSIKVEVLGNKIFEASSYIVMIASYLYSSIRMENNYIGN